MNIEVSVFASFYDIERVSISIHSTWNYWKAFDRCIALPSYRTHQMPINIRIRYEWLDIITQSVFYQDFEKNAYWFTYGILFLKFWEQQEHTSLLYSRVKICCATFFPFLYIKFKKRETKYDYLSRQFFPYTTQKEKKNPLCLDECVCVYLCLCSDGSTKMLL